MKELFKNWWVFKHWWMRKPCFIQAALLLSHRHCLCFIPAALLLSHQHCSQTMRWHRDWLERWDCTVRLHMAIQHDIYMLLTNIYESLIYSPNKSNHQTNPYILHHCTYCDIDPTVGMGLSCILHHQHVGATSNRHRGPKVQGLVVDFYAS